MGIVVALGGIALIILSSYITNRIEGGKTEIGSAQRQVDQGNSLFSFNPATKAVGKGLFTDSSQRKINAANQEVVQYETLVKWFQIGGIVLIILGAGIVFIGRKK